MDENITTPIISESTPDTGEVNNSVNLETGNLETGETNKIPETVPYYKVREQAKKIRELEARLGEMTPYVDSYQQLMQVIENNPAYRQDLEGLYEKHFGEKKAEGISGEEAFTGFEDDETKAYLRKLNERVDSIENLTRETQMNIVRANWDKQIAEVLSDAPQKGLKINKNDIHLAMRDYNAPDPKTAYRYLLGEKIEDVRKTWEVNYKKGLEGSKKATTPPIPGAYRPLNGKRPKDFGEAAQTALKSGRDFLQNEK